MGCSMVADQVAHPAHLNARDTTLAFVSRAPQAEIQGLKERMGWETIPWYTLTDDFDADFGVDEWHGTNAFFRDGDRIFRTYFVDSRGDEAMGSTWSYLDITALGRQEEREDSPEGYPQTPPYHGGTTTTRTERPRDCALTCMDLSRATQRAVVVGPRSKARRKSRRTEHDPMRRGAAAGRRINACGSSSCYTTRRQHGGSREDRARSVARGDHRVTTAGVSDCLSVTGAVPASLEDTGDIRFGGTVYADVRLATCMTRAPQQASPTADRARAGRPSRYGFWHGGVLRTARNDIRTWRGTSRQ